MDTFKVLEIRKAQKLSLLRGIAVSETIKFTLSQYGEDKTPSEGETNMDGKRAQGGKEMKKHEMGVRLTQRQAILAKCYECANGYLDGKEDCSIPDCPLHPFMPYRAKR